MTNSSVSSSVPSFVTKLMAKSTSLFSSATTFHLEKKPQLSLKQPPTNHQLKIRLNRQLLQPKLLLNKKLRMNRFK